jgi:hypothetical protein
MGTQTPAAKPRAPVSGPPPRRLSLVQLVAKGERVAAAPEQEYARSMRAVAGTARYWVPLLAGLLCLIAVLFVGSLLGWLLIILAFGLLLDGATAMFERAGGTGNLTTYRQ